MTTERVERRLTAIASADVVGYSRLMGLDEAGTRAALNSHRQNLIDPKLDEHHGRLVSTAGDSLLVEFRSVVDAVQWAVEVQRGISERNADTPEDRRIVFRIGINLGDVIVEGDDIHGDGVNVAARLQALSEPGGICISRKVFEEARNRVSVGFEDLGEQSVKNIAEPIRTYRVLVETEAAGKVVGRKEARRRLPKRWRWAIPVAAAVVVIGVAAGVLLTLEPWVPRVEAAVEADMAFPLPEKPSIVVLPFENVGGDPQQDHFADGVTGDIITHLSRLPYFFVIDRNTTFAYKGKTPTAKQVAEELGVRYLLGGSVQRSGERLRITTQLIDAVSGRHVWSQRYDREATDLFALQDDITRNVSVALEVELTEGEQAALWRRYSGESLEAWEFSSQAFQHFLSGTREGHAKARELTKKAIAAGGEQPTFLAILSMTHVNDVLMGYSEDPGASLTRAGELAKRALELDDTNPFLFVVLSEIALVEGRHEEAINHAEKAIALAPNMADAHANLAQKLSFAGRSEEAIPMMQKAMRLSPIYPDWYIFELATEYHLAGRLEEALPAYRVSAERSPDAIGGLPLAMLAVAAWESGRYEEARAAIADLLNRQPDYTLADYARLTSLVKDCCEQHYDVLRELGLPEHPPLPLPDKPSIAVLPFTNMSNDPEQEYFSDGITEQIIAELARFDGLFVVARNSTFRYKGRAVDVREVGRELGANYVLEGSVRRASDTIRVTAQLLDATSGAHLWAETYDRGLSADSIFAVQDDITEHVVGALADPHGIISRARMGEAVNKKTGSLSAYDCVLRVYAYRRAFRPEEHQRVRECLERAVERDPDYVDAWAWLALIYSDEYRYEYNTRPDALERSLAAAQRAVTLDRTSQLAHWILARTYFWLHQIDGFLTECEKAIALNANNSEVVASCGMYMANTGQWERGVELTHKAIALNPGHPDWFHFTFFFDHYRKGDDEQALAVLRKINMPSFWWTHATLAAVHGQLGNTEDARAALDKLLELYPTFPDKPREIFQRWNYPESLIDRLIEGLRIAGLPEGPS